MDNCIFCKIIKKESPAKVAAETENVIAFDSIAPIAAHHILIVPKPHIASFLDFDESHKDLVMEMIKVAQEVIKDRKIENAYRLCINGGEYQHVKHFHWHILGGDVKEEDVTRT